MRDYEPYVRMSEVGAPGVPSRREPEFKPDPAELELWTTRNRIARFAHPGGRADWKVKAMALEHLAREIKEINVTVPTLKWGQYGDQAYMIPPHELHTPVVEL